MSNVKIVTGHSGSAHITSNDWQSLNQGLSGAGNCVLNVGSRFAVTTAISGSNMVVTISDGEGMMQGVHFRIPSGKTDKVNIPLPASGYVRWDYLCARYTKNVSTGVETVNWYLVQGTPVPASGSPSYPTPTSGDIRAGDVTVDFPIWKVATDSAGSDYCSCNFMFNYDIASSRDGYKSISTYKDLTGSAVSANLGQFSRGIHLVVGYVEAEQTSGSTGSVRYGYTANSGSNNPPGHLLGTINTSSSVRHGDGFSFLVVADETRNAYLHFTPASNVATTVYVTAKAIQLV